MVIFNASLFGRESSGTGRRESMTNTVKYTHAAEYEQYNQRSCHSGIDTPYPFGGNADTGMYFVMSRTAGFGSEYLNASHSENRQNGNCEKYNSQTSYPLCHCPPEKDSVWH